jgi:hypothetical protein
MRCNEFSSEELEEFYTIVSDKEHLQALQHYLKRTCAQGQCPGKLTEHAIAFLPSQVNQEFYDYMLKNLKPLALE